MAQRGQVFKRGGSWHYRYYDSALTRHQKGGFRTKSEATDVLNAILTKQRTGSVLATLTFDDLVRDFLAQYQKSESRVTVVRWALAKAQERFGKVRLDRLNARDLGEWRSELPVSQQHQVFAVVRQVLEKAVRWKMLDANPALDVENPLPVRLEVDVFESWDDVDAVAAELGEEWGALVVLAAGTGLRPQEWSALEWRDVDWRGRALMVRRTVIDGVVREFQGKTKGSIRRVPLRARVEYALNGQRQRAELRQRLIFPGARGGYLNVDNWRRRDWFPALEAAGLERRTPYALRHSYATWSIAAGVDLFVLARRMGTSVEMIDRTYGHLLPRGEDAERSLLDAWDMGAAGSGAGSDHGRVSGNGGKHA